MADQEREEWRALAEADTLHMLPTEALIASIKSLAERLLACDDNATFWMQKASEYQHERNLLRLRLGEAI